MKSGRLNVVMPRLTRPDEAGSASATHSASSSVVPRGPAMMSNQYQPPSMNCLSDRVRSMERGSSVSTLIVSTGWLRPLAEERVQHHGRLAGDPDPQRDRVEVGPPAPVAGRERAEVGGEGDPAALPDRRGAARLDLLPGRHRQAGAEPDAVLCLARDRVDGLRLRVGRGVLLLAGEPVGGQFGGTALQVGLHVQRHHVEVLAGEHDPLQDAELAAGRVQRVRGQVGADQLSHCRLLPAWPAAGGR